MLKIIRYNSPNRDSGRCNACLYKYTEIELQAGNTDENGNFTGGVYAFGLCKDCAKDLLNQLNEILKHTD